MVASEASQFVCVQTFVKIGPSAIALKRIPYLVHSDPNDLKHKVKDINAILQPPTLTPLQKKLSDCWQLVYEIGAFQLIQPSKLSTNYS